MVNKSGFTEEGKGSGVSGLRGMMFLFLGRLEYGSKTGSGIPLDSALMNFPNIDL